VSGRADPPGFPDQDGAGAGNVEHTHALADTGRGQQSSCHLMEEPDLVIACGGPAEQAGNALLGAGKAA
jgi:hypothetical protein